MHIGNCVNKTKLNNRQQKKNTNKAFESKYK